MVRLLPDLASGPSNQNHNKPVFWEHGLFPFFLSYSFIFPPLSVYFCRFYSTYSSQLNIASQWPESQSTSQTFQLIFHHFFLPDYFYPISSGPGLFMCSYLVSWGATLLYLCKRVCLEEKRQKERKKWGNSKSKLVAKRTIFDTIKKFFFWKIEEKKSHFTSKIWKRTFKTEKKPKTT